MDYLHNIAKITHRNIHPGNILFDSEGNVKMSDFGISVLSEYSGQKNIEFCSPEVLDKIFRKNKSSDIWALGVVIAKCLNIKSTQQNLTLENPITFKID
jgi:serine/threonine protein kinase